MKKKPVNDLANDVSYQIGRYIMEREEVINEGQFKELTSLIESELSRITQPTPEQFEARRKPWVRIMERVLVEIAAGEFPHPYEFNHMDGDQVLFIRLSSLMDHLIRGHWMAMSWDELTIRTSQALRSELRLAGVLMADGNGKPGAFKMGGKNSQPGACLNLTKMFKTEYFHPVKTPFN